MKLNMPALAIALATAFSSVSYAQDAGEAQECNTPKIMQYNMEQQGQTLQSTGAITSNPESEKIEIYGNTRTHGWTIVEYKNSGEACIYKLGGIFFNEGAREEDGEKTVRQSAFAYHGYGEGNNEAFELMVHEGTGRWVLSRRISEIRTEVVLAGRNYEEFNLPPRLSGTHVSNDM